MGELYINLPRYYLDGLTSVLRVLSAESSPALFSSFTAEMRDCMIRKHLLVKAQVFGFSYGIWSCANLKFLKRSQNFKTWERPGTCLFFENSWINSSVSDNFGNQQDEQE